jgi:diadenosine tetraphosphate (Ap4A) HIT family hydrolase
MQKSEPMSRHEDDLADICSFCSEIERRPERNLFLDVIGADVGDAYLLRETANFVIMPAIGSLMPGYCLAVPRAHVLSFGCLPASHHDELADLLRGVERWLLGWAGPNIILFEHGSASFTERGGSCTDHAHLHIVPVPPHVDLMPAMAQDFAVRQVSGLVAAARQQLAERRGGYVFLRHHDGRSYIADAPQAVSQHLRRDLVVQLGIPDQWDWALFPGSAHIRATIRHANSTWIR